MNRTITVYADVEVEVDLGRFSTDDLMAEIRSRNDLAMARRLDRIEAEHNEKMEELGHERENYVHIPPLSSGESHPLHGIYYALKFGKKEHAIDLMRDYLGDQFGVVL